MEFKISRTSMWNETKPCDNAYRKEIIRIDERGFETPEEHDERLPRDKKWLEEGFNHKILPPNKRFKTQHIYREFNEEIWAIKIDTLQELLNLFEIYGDLVIKTSFENDNVYEIEIYDDWRE